jgi:hypothetical protein
MHIYNVTVNVENNILNDWLSWMKQTHIPEVMATGMFLSCQINKVLVEEEQGETYAIQYSAKDLQSIRLYQELYGPELQQKTRARYGDKLVAFRTLMEVVFNYQAD